MGGAKRQEKEEAKQDSAKAQDEVTEDDVEEFVLPPTPPPPSRDPESAWLLEAAEAPALPGHDLCHDGFMTQTMVRKMVKRRPHRQNRATVVEPVTQSSNPNLVVVSQVF